MNQVNSYRFQLDNSRPTKLFHCPECGKREFKRYVDNETGDYMAEHLGLCNRLNNCGHHYTPKQFFADNPNAKMLEVGKPLYRAFPTSNMVDDAFSTIPFGIFEKSQSQFVGNHFVSYLKNLFGDDLAMQLVKRFHIGTSKYWHGATVFWQVDILGNVRAGKIMLYDVDTGKRRKDYNGKKYINWAHIVLKTPNFNLDQCLFGQHQLRDAPSEKTVAIVESEKTAILMTAILPNYVWLATGGLHNLKAERCQILRGRKVILFPDLNAFEKWKAKETALKQIGCQVTTSDLLERHATAKDKTEGYDLADYFLQRDEKTGWAMDSMGYPLFWNIYFLTKKITQNG
jgi:Domain of unknown function (DUF6371)